MSQRYFEGDPVPITGEGCNKPFPVGVLPADIARFVEAVAASTETDPALAAVVVLGVFSAITAGRVSIEVQEGWSEPSNLYIVAVLASGEGKSPVFAKVARILQEIERQLIEETKALVAERRAEREVIEEQIKAYKRKVGKADADEREVLLADIGELAARLEQKPAIAYPRLLANDATPEALARLAAENEGIIAVVSAETPIFGTVSGARYSGAPNFEFLLSGHSGESFTVDRMNREPEHIEAAYLTLCVAVQPIVMRSARKVQDLEERGLLGRVLFAWPESRVGYRRRKLVPLADAELRSWESRVRSTFERLRKAAVQLGLSPEARAALEGWRGGIERERRPGGRLEHIAAWGGKYDSQVIRLSSLLAVMHDEESIGERRMRDAIDLGAYFEANVLCLYQDLGISDLERSVQRLKRRIVEKNWGVCTKRDLHRAAKAATADECSAMVERLEEDHWILEEPRNHGGSPRGGRPTTEYRVNPRVHELYRRDKRDKTSFVASVPKKAGR